MYMVNTNDINISYKLFEYLTKNNIVIDMILQNAIDDKRSILSFTVSKDDLLDVIKILDENKKELCIENMSDSIDVEEDLSKISIVGNGIMSNTKVLGKIYKILEEENIRFHSIVTSEIKISILVKTVEAEKLMNLLHMCFFEK